MTLFFAHLKVYVECVCLSCKEVCVIVCLEDKIMLCHGPLHFIAFIQGFVLVFSAFKKLCCESLCALRHRREIKQRLIVCFISVLLHKAAIIFQRFGEGLCTGEMESFVFLVGCVLNFIIFLWGFQETPNSLWVQRKGIMSVLFVHVGFYTSILFLFHIL